MGGSAVVMVKKALGRIKHHPNSTPNIALHCPAFFPRNPITSPAMPAEDSDRERRRRRASRDPESDRERRRDADTYRRRRGHRATDSQGDLLPKGDRTPRDHGSSSTPRTRRGSRATSSSRPLSTGGLAALNNVNAKQGYDERGYDVDYLEEVRAKEMRLEKERRKEERKAERERRRALRAERAESSENPDRYGKREERQRRSERELSQGETTDRERRREEERERRREEKRQLRRAEKAQEKEEERQRQLELAQEQAAAEERERMRHAEREKQRQLRKEQHETRRQRPRETTRDHYDDDSYASSPARTPHKSKRRGGGAVYGEVGNEDSPQAKYFEKAHSPKRKARVISGPYLEDQQDEVYAYRKDKLEDSSQASDYTSTTIWKTKRNKRICECNRQMMQISALTRPRYLCWCATPDTCYRHTRRCCVVEEEQ